MVLTIPIAKASKYFYCMENTLLSQPEKTILYCMAEGLGNKQMSILLGISESTIGDCKQTMLKKTNTDDNRQLLRYAIKTGMIDY